MNQLDAITYVCAASGADGGVDLRLAAFLAAMVQLDLPYEKVGLNGWWSARCQLGMLLGKQMPEVGFEVSVPCGKNGVPKKADADEFADLAYRPCRCVVKEARRRYDLMLIGRNADRDPLVLPGQLVLWG
jgi:hypothetical protein